MSAAAMNSAIYFIKDCVPDKPVAHRCIQYPKTIALPIELRACNWEKTPNKN